MRIRFHPAARQEVRRARRWYARHSEVAAAAFAVELEAASPDRYQAGSHDTRRQLMRHFPFTVVYQVAGDGVVIVAVAHQSRTPNYWADRTS